MSTAKKQSRKIQLVGDSNNPRVPLNDIEIVTRPNPGEEHTKLFYNPRRLESFTPESMAELYTSIRTDELLENLVVRVFGTPDDVDKIELLAGERRLRTLLKLVSDDVPCYSSALDVPAKWKANSVVLHEGRFAQVKKHANGGGVEIVYFDEHEKLTDETATVAATDLLPTAPASKVYASVPCKVLYNISDERALRVTMTENQKHRNLTIAEEIEAVERLIRMGLKQQKIAYMMATNITWVSQTSSFRGELPKEAFEKLMANEMSRNVAVNFLGYRPEDRQALYEATVEAEQADTRQRVQEHTLAEEQAQDEREILEESAKQADAAGDKKTAAKRRKKAEAAGKRAEVAGEKKRKAQENAGTIKQGHVQKAAAETGIAPKKAKVLPRPDIEAFAVQAGKLIGKKTIDPICNEKVPDQALMFVQATADAILAGQRDPLAVVRTVMVKLDKWSVPDSASQDDEEDDADRPDEDDPDAFDPDEYDPDEFEGDGVDPDEDDDGYQSIEDYMHQNDDENE